MYNVIHFRTASGPLFDVTAGHFEVPRVGDHMRTAVGRFVVLDVEWQPLDEEVFVLVELLP